MAHVLGRALRRSLATAARIPATTLPRLAPRCRWSVSHTFSAAVGQSLPRWCSSSSTGDGDPAKTVSLRDIPGVTRGESFVMLYTCKQCSTRSARQISKQAYNEGVVIVECPGCQALHLVADNLDLMKFGKLNIEDVIAKRDPSAVLDANVIDLTPDDLKLLYKEATTKLPERPKPKYRERPDDV